MGKSLKQMGKDWDLGRVGRKLETGVGKALGYDERPQKKKEKESRELAEKQASESRGVLDYMNKSDTAYQDDLQKQSQKYLSDSRTAGNSYLSRVKEFESQAESQMRDAQATYSNDIQPKQKGLMEDAYKNSQSAMTLDEAMDPNNKVARGIRDLYNNEGQTIRNQGLADSGVLAAMGAQAMQGQLSGMPVVTGSNLATLGAQSQRQAGEAYAQAAKRMQDLREQGLGKGIEQSNLMYDKGQQSKAWAADMANNYQQGYDKNVNQQRGFRDELGAYNADRFGVEKGMAGEEFDVNRGLSENLHNMNMGSGQRDLGYFDQTYAARQQGIANEIARRDKAGFRGAVNGFLGMAGGMMGNSANKGDGAAQYGSGNPQGTKAGYGSATQSGGFTGGYGGSSSGSNSTSSLALQGNGGQAGGYASNYNDSAVSGVGGRMNQMEQQRRYGYGRYAS